MFLRMAALLAVTLGSDSSEKDIKNYAALENPFRMQKINLGVCVKTAGHPNCRIDSNPVLVPAGVLLVQYCRRLICRCSE
jgi:hypothetical protein